MILLRHRERRIDVIFYGGLMNKKDKKERIVGLLLDTSKSLDEIVREFEKVGIKVKDDNENYKSFITVINELAKEFA